MNSGARACGEVNRHFFQRFGAAILISLISGAVQGAVASQSSGSTVVYNPSGSQDVMTEVLKETINIPPTVTKNQGDRIEVLVARDLISGRSMNLSPARPEESLMSVCATGGAARAQQSGEISALDLTLRALSALARATRGDGALYQSPGIAFLETREGWR